MAGEGKQEQWTRYLQGLKEKHARKRRLIEILDRMAQSSGKIIRGRSKS
jgi:uncharacterized Zn finger protein